MYKIKLLYIFLGFTFSGFAQDSVNQSIREFNRLYDVTIDYQNTNIDSAHYYLDSCFDISKKLKESYYFGKLLQLKTRDEFYRGEVDSSIIYGNHALDILKKYPDSLEYFMAEYNLGNTFLSNDDNIQALIQFKKATQIIDENYEVFVQIDRQMVILNNGYCHASIGLVLMNLDDYTRALENFTKALKITYKVKNLESQFLRSVVLRNMGSAYNRLGDYDMAESYAIASLEQKKALGQESSIGYSFQVLANSAYGRKKNNLALKYLDQSDKKFEILNNVLELERNEFFRAKNYIEIGEYKKTIFSLKNIEESFKNNFPKENLADLYELLSFAYYEVGDLKFSNDYLRKTLKLREELNEKNHSEIVQEFITFFENEEIQLNHKIQNLKNIQTKEKLELQIAGDNEKKVWIYTLFLVSIVCLVLIIMVISNAYRRNKKTNRELSDTIEEKQILFKEVHHRVKNNFQIISSLLNLQHGIEEDERGRKVLTDAQGRIQSMSLVHEMLYRKNEVKRIDFKDYADELVSSIVSSFTDESIMIGHEINCNHESFDLEVAVPLGLILNEAVTNSVKYAFSDLKVGRIEIELKNEGSGYFFLRITDNGIGIPQEYINGSKETLGIELINILSEQLGGAAQIKNIKGTEIVVQFKV